MVVSVIKARKKFDGSFALSLTLLIALGVTAGVLARGMTPKKVTAVQTVMIAKQSPAKALPVILKPVSRTVKPKLKIVVPVVQTRASNSKPVAQRFTTRVRRYTRSTRVRSNRVSSARIQVVRKPVVRVVKRVRQRPIATTRAS